MGEYRLIRHILHYMKKSEKKPFRIVEPINLNVYPMNSVSTTPGNVMVGKTAEMDQMKKSVLSLTSLKSMTKMIRLVVRLKEKMSYQSI